MSELPIEEAGPGSPSGVPESFALLRELALDLRWSWSHQADAIWEEINPELWRETSNPWLIFQTASEAHLAKLCDRPDFLQRVHAMAKCQAQALEQSAWFQRTHAGRSLQRIAFFSLEFGLCEALPIYSGGLGNVAGDYLQAASDLGVPMVGVGLLYQQGYFRQMLDASGYQQESYPFNDTSQLPITPVRDTTGHWVRVALPRPGPTLWLRAWQARVGRVTLYLLDSNHPSNLPSDRGLTSELYGGGPQQRLLQEMALGIGGFRLLQAIGKAPDVCHLNEGHAAFVVLERARWFMQSEGVPFEVALAATRAGNLFTTHTPVAPGFDRFEPEAIAGYLGTYARDELGIDVEALMALGRVHPADTEESLNMALLATRGSYAINAVSQRHGEVSRSMFSELFPRWPVDEVPIGHVTNGVNVPGWDSAEADALWTRQCGAERWRRVSDELIEPMVNVPDVDFWSMRGRCRQGLVRFVRERLPRQLEIVGAEPSDVGDAEHVLDPDALTIGFARRFTSYKRPGLLLTDPERLARLLTNRDRPVQLVMAGKAHPRDEEGKRLVQDWVWFCRRADVRSRVVFLADYDLGVAERLVQGVDLWLNTPRPPWEACGTSGMKVLVNGGLNCSALDGWWAEAYTPEVGWALQGTGERDDLDARELYEVLENEVIPTFFRRDERGVPTDWVRKMRASMSTLTPQYSASRALREYVNTYYLPAADAVRARTEARGEQARQLVRWRDDIDQHWAHLRFGEQTVTTEAGIHHFRVQVYMNDLSPRHVVVQLYANKTDSAPSQIVAMTREALLVGSSGAVFSASVSDTRPAADYTPRLVPDFPGANVPLECPAVLWGR